MSQVPLDWKRLLALVLFGLVPGALAAFLCVRMAALASSEDRRETEHSRRGEALS